jgi:hypothetical protein
MFVIYLFQIQDYATSNWKQGSDRGNVEYKAGFEDSLG